MAKGFVLLYGPFTLNYKAKKSLLWHNSWIAANEATKNRLYSTKIDHFATSDLTFAAK